MPVHLGDRRIVGESRVDELNDTIRDDVAADMTSWLNRQLGQRQSAAGVNDVIVTPTTEAEQPRL